MWFSKVTRFVLTALVFLFAVYQFVEGEIGNGIFLLLLTGIVLATVWFNEAMLLAFLALRKQDFAKTKKWLDKIDKPELMLKSQTAYYYYLMGLVMSQSREMGKSEGMFKKALSLGLRMEHDRAMAKLNLAGVAAAKRRKREATNWLSQAKKEDTKGLLNDQIKMMKDQLKRI